MQPVESAPAVPTKPMNRRRCTQEPTSPLDHHNMATMPILAALAAIRPLGRTRRVIIELVG